MSNLPILETELPLSISTKRPQQSRRSYRILSGPMRCLHLVDLALNFLHLDTCPLDGRLAVSFAVPALNVPLHLVDPAVFLVNVVAQLALVRLLDRVEYQLQAARFACPVLLVALLFELTPSPIPANPARLVEITHLFFFSPLFCWLLPFPHPFLLCIFDSVASPLFWSPKRREMSSPVFVVPFLRFFFLLVCRFNFLAGRSVAG